MTLYIPPSAKKISELDATQIRLGLIGNSGTGKTYSALTFPNPVVIDIDNNLLAHKKREDVLVLPFHNSDWIYSWWKYNKNELKFPIRDAVIKWIKEEGPKLSNEQTLFIDSWTTLQDAFDAQADPSIEPVYSKDGSINDYAFWDKKVDFSREVLSLLKTLKCHCVVSFHKQTVSGISKLLQKEEPAMQGKFVKKIGLYFTDFFQTEVIPKMASDGKTIADFDYMWRTRSTSDIDLKTRMKCDALIKPHFSSFTYDK